MSLAIDKPGDSNGHTWEFIPYARFSREGSFRCSTCLTSYDLGHGRDLVCDKGASLRKATQQPTKHKPATPALIQAWQKMAEHTCVKCGSPTCHTAKSTRCCDKLYCQITADYALEEHDVTLVATGHPELPFMGPTGCVVAPHLRPLCTLHQCAINSLGFLPDDKVWTTEYFRLREQIDVLEEERQFS